MTTRPVTTPAPEVRGITQLPDPRPCDLDMSTFRHVNLPAYPASLIAHFGKPDTTIVISETAAAVRPTQSYEGVLFPDLLIAFDVDAAAGAARNGYLIPEQGKPPDFVLEVASASTARRDENQKREGYAAMGIREYWRFDHTGGQYHSTSLAGDRLVDGGYQAIPINRSDEGHQWGHSDALGLDLCWEEGELRWWDPVAGRYLPTFNDERARADAAETQRNRERTRANAERDARVQAEAHASTERDARVQAEAHADTERDARAQAETRANAERDARADAEARIRGLEAELERRRHP